MLQKNIANWGIFGTGTVAGLFAEGLKNIPEARLYGIASRSEENARRFTDVFGAVKSYASYNELVNDKDIDIIYIATPTSLHKEHCLLCLEAGKPVICEKPFAINALDAQEIIRTAKMKKVFCMEAMWMRFLPLIRDLPRLCDSNSIGDIRVIQAFLGHNHAFNPSSQLFNRDLGGGSVLDLGCYLLSFVFSLWGEPQNVSSHIVKGKTGVDEEASIILEYSENRTAILGCSIRSSGPNNAFIIGTKGMIEVKEPLYRPHKAVIHSMPLIQSTARFNASSSISCLKNNPVVRKIAVTLKEILQIFGVSGGVSVKTSFFKGNGYNYEAAEAMRCLCAGKTESNIMPLDESLKILKIIDTILKS